MSVCAWDWQAISGFFQGGMTLIVGVGAVVGAYRIGKRQIAILESQTEILSSQTEIQGRQATAQEAAWKQSLFARRIAIYETTLNFCLAVSYDGYAGPPIRNAFERAVMEAAYLFSDEVNSYLTAIEKLALILNQAHGRMASARGQKEYPKAVSNYDQAHNDFRNKQMEIIWAFREMSLAEMIN